MLDVILFVLANKYMDEYRNKKDNFYLYEMKKNNIILSRLFLKQNQLQIKLKVFRWKTQNHIFLLT